MKKIYLQPEMELTECVLLRTAVCSGGENPDIDNGDNDPWNNAPARRKVF